MKTLLPLFLFLLTAAGLQAQSDACLDAEFLFPSSDCTPVEGSTASGTDENNPADCIESADGNQLTVWYQFQATAETHIVTVTPDAGFDLVIGAIESCNDILQPVGGACTNAGGPGVAESLSLSGLTIGNPYYIGIHEYNGLTATFNICVQEVPLPPVNDACENAVLLTSNEICLPESGTTAGAINENASGDCTTGTPNSVWYQFEAVSFLQTITVNGNFDFDAVIAASTGCGSTQRPTGGDCVNATGDGGTEILVLQDLTVGETYYIQIHDFNGGGGQFDICVVGDPLLPIRLVSFEGEQHEEMNLLRWRTASEDNSRSFRIIRSSDGINGWEMIGEKSAAGSSIQSLDYTFEDHRPIAKAFYRLKMEDRDGSTAFSPVIQIQRKGDSDWARVSPNPFQSFLETQLSLRADQVLSLRVSDLSGREVYASNKLISAGDHSIRIPTTDWTAGWFVLRVESQEGLQILRVLKQ